MSIKPGDALTVQFTTRSPTTGGETNADSLPTGAMVHNGVDDGTVTVTVTSVSTGLYKAAATVPSGYAKGDVVQLRIAATVGGVSDQWHVLTASLDSKRVGDLNDLGGTAQSGDAYARLGAPAGASVSADVAAVKSDTGTILTDVNTGAGAIYTRIGAPAGASIAADIAAVKTSVGAPQQAGSAVTLPANPPAGFLVTASYGTAPGWFPAHFTNATFVSDGVFAAAALANAPSGGGGSVTVAGYAAGQDPATLVLGATAASWNNSGTIGQKINSAGGAADPLLNVVPGSYAAGTAGNILGNLASTMLSAGGLGSFAAGTAGNALSRLFVSSITVVSPVAATGAIGPLYAGSDYTGANALTISDNAANWPDNATWAFLVYDAAGNPVTTGISVSVSPASGAGKVATISVPKADTTALAGSTYDYSLVPTVGGSVYPPVVESTLTVSRR